MRDALKAAGLDKAPRIELEEGRYRCYLEAHIEQGGVLEHDRQAHRRRHRDRRHLRRIA